MPTRERPHADERRLARCGSGAGTGAASDDRAFERVSMAGRPSRIAPATSAKSRDGTFTATRRSKAAAEGSRGAPAGEDRADDRGRADAAHIHIGQRGRPGPVRSGSVRAMLGTAFAAQHVLTPAVRWRRFLKTGTCVREHPHAAKNAAGEIRGQIRAVALTIS